MTALFELVLDIGNSTCYTSGQTVANLSTLGTPSDNNYYLGTGSGVDASDPTFVGVAGALDRTCYFNSDTPGGKVFTPVGTPTVLTTAHQSAGQFTMICGGHLPSSIATNAYPISTAKMEGTTQGPGVALRIATNRVAQVLVHGDAGASVYARNFDAALSASAYFLIGCGIQNGNNRSWCYTSTYSNPSNPAPSLYGHFSTVFTPVYSSPSVSAAQSKAYMWRDGATGTKTAPTDFQLSFLLVSNTWISRQQILPLMRTLYRRQLSNLP